MPKSLAFFLIVVFSNFCFSAGSTKPNDALDLVLQQAASKKIHEKYTWRKLLHYEPDSPFNSGVKSAIHSEIFFLSPSGRTNSEEEMAATIKAMFQPLGDDHNKHAQCAFRARYLWLKEALEISDDVMPRANCLNFQQWAKNDQPESISIVFATGYLGNPASYYGHTLIKFNANDKQRDSNLLDVSVNYGAIVPDNENPVSYILKGVLGGYDAGFSHTEYYYHNHNYGEVELRDLWEYELSLSLRDTKLIMAHAWELLGKKYTYYFLTKNCAYRMGELLEIIEGVKINPDNSFWVVPQALIQQIDKAEYSGKPLVKRMEYHPSRQSRLYNKFESLSVKQKRFVKRIVKDQSLLESSNFQDEPLVSKHLMLDTLLDYYQYVRDPQALSADESNIAYQNILSRRYKLAPGKEQKTARLPDAPNKGRAPSLIQMGLVDNRHRGTGGLLTIRPAYYDELDAGSGHIKNAELTMGRLQLEYFDSDVDIRSLEVVNIQSVNNRMTGLPGDDNNSWRLQLGLEKQNLKCDRNCLVARLQADKGYTWVTTGSTVFGSYLGGAIQDSRNSHGNLFVRATNFVSYEFRPELKMKFEHQYRRHIDSVLNEENAFRFMLRYALTLNSDIRFSVEYNQTEEVGLHFGHYW